MKIKTECKLCGKSLIRNAGFSMYFCDTGCKAEWQKTQRPVTVEWLRQKYEVEKMDCTAIGKLVKRDSKSVWNWLKASGIPTRKRGTTDNWRFVKNHYWKGKKMPKKIVDKIRAAAIARGSCPAMINGVHWTKVYPGRKTASWKGGITPERQAVYSSPEWKQAVIGVWKRDCATCQRCKRGKNKDRKVSFDIHHIRSFEVKELRTDINNLVLLCEPCHYWVHSAKNKKKQFIK